MDATQQIESSFFEEENSEDEKERKGKKEREPLAALKVFKNDYIPETEIPLYLGENVLGRDPAVCSVSLQVPSVSGRHAVISISVFRPHDHCHGHIRVTEALLWDLGSLNGTRKGRLKLTPHVRYALADGDAVVLADLPCQFVGLESVTRCAGPARRAAGDTAAPRASSAMERTGGGVVNGGAGSASPPPAVGSAGLKRNDQTPTKSPPQPESTIVPDSDSDSEEDEGRRRGRRILGSASSDLSGPACSTFLTPADKVIPESEDESSVTPASGMAGRSVKSDASSDSRPAPLTFSTDSDPDAEEQEVDATKAEPAAKAEVVTPPANLVSPDNFHVDSDTDVEEEEEEEGKREASASTTRQDSVTPAGVSMDTNVCGPLRTRPTAEQVLASPVVAPLPADFQMDSDTDAEDDVTTMTVDSLASSKLETPVAISPADHGTGIPMARDCTSDAETAAPKVSNTNSDSDTDDEGLFKAGQGKTAQAAHPHSDSDTDLDDDTTQAKTPAVTTAPPRCARTERGAVTPHGNPDLARDTGDFRMDSDTDVEEEEEKTEERGQKSAQGAAQIIQSSTPRGAGFCEEEVETQAFLSPSQIFRRPPVPSPLCPSPSAGGCGVETDDFTVAETQSFVSSTPPDNATLDETPASPKTPGTQPSHGAPSVRLGLSDSGHRQPESEEYAKALGPPENGWEHQATQSYASPRCAPTERGAVTPHGNPNLARDTGDFRMDSDTDVEEEEEKTEERGQKSAQGAAQIIQSSTPRGAGFCEEEVETQAFLGPSQTFRPLIHSAAALPSPLCPSLGASGVETSDFAVAETQSFVSHASPGVTTLDETPASPRTPRTPRTQPSHGASSFCLGLSDSGHRQSESLASGPPENDWEHQATQSYGGGEASAGTEQKQLHLQATQAYTVQLDQEEEEEEEEEIQALVPLGLSAAERRLVSGVQEEDGGTANRLSGRSVAGGGLGVEEEERDVLVDSHLSTAETLLLIRSPRQEEQTQPYGLLQTASLEEVEKEEEEKEEAPSSEAGSTGCPCRGGVVDEERSHPAEPDANSLFSTTETQPICEDEEKWEEERPAEPRTSRRPQRRRQTGPAQAESDAYIHVATAEIVGEDEVHEEEPRSSRRPRRGRRVETEPKQPIEPDTMSAAEMQPVKEEEIQVMPANLPSLRGKNGGGGRGAFGRGRRRIMEEEEEEGSKEVERGRKRRGGRNTRQKSKDKEEKEREERERLEKEQEEREERERLEKEQKERERLEKEQKEREEMERLEKEQKERERLEKEQKERERLEKEQKEREEKLEKERRNQEKIQIERERTEEKGKKKRLEKEKKESEELEQKLEKEKQEEKGRLGRERRKREEKEPLRETEKQEMEARKHLERQHKETEDEKPMRRPQRQRKTVLGRNGKELEKEGHERFSKASTPGTVAQITLEKEAEQGDTSKREREDLRSKNQEEEQGKAEVKPRRGRCPTRKSLVPPAALESLMPPDHSEGVSAKRTRSRSSSEHSTSTSEHQTQGLGRKTANAESDNGRPSVKRRATTAPSSGVEDTLQGSSAVTRSRSSSRSSERSSTSRGGRGRKSAKVEEPEEERPRSVTAGRGRGRGRGRGARNPPAGVATAGTTDEAHPEKEESGDTSVTETSVLRQASSRGCKRGADSATGSAGAPQPSPKTPRRSLAGQTHKVLFTGVVDQDGEKVVQRLGGGLAKGVADMTHLVTDKVRRTVKFLCAVARGVPIVTPDWLVESAKTGSFISANEYLVKDKEQEKRFNFSLQEALRVARVQPLLQGYEIHVTPSVKPEPPQMKEIITCCGARYLPKMPSAPKAQTLVVSCEEDRALFERALTLSVPVVCAEFLLTGILRQRVDLHTHALSASSAAAPKPSSRGRKK